MARSETVAHTITLTLDGLAEQLRKAHAEGAAGARAQLDSTQQALNDERAHSKALREQVLGLTNSIKEFASTQVQLEVIKGRERIEMEKLKGEAADTKLLLEVAREGVSEVRQFLAGAAAGATAPAALKEVLGEVFGELMADRADAVEMRTQLRNFLGVARWSRLMEAASALF
jgi:hypothetical protein